MKHIAPLSVLVLLVVGCALVLVASDAAYAGTSAQPEALAPRSAGPFVSDDFNACALDETLWTWVDPVGDSTFGLENPFTDTARLTIAVPADTAHDIWTNGNFAPRMMQTITDTDFEIEAKYDSPVSQRYQMQGILVEQDANNFLRIEYYSQGTSTRLLVAVFSGTEVPLSIDTKADQPVGAKGITPLYLRVGRLADDWTVSTSLDGAEWNEAIDFTHAMTVTGAGVYAANAGSDPPAHIAQIDYVFNTDTPIVPEDGARNSLALTIVGDGTVTVDPDKPEYDCGEVITLTATANTGSQFDGWQGPDGADLQDNGDGTWSLTMDGPKEVTAQFSITTRYTLTVDIVGQGEVLVVPEGPYLPDATVTLTPEPDEDWRFGAWTGPDASDLQDNGDGTWSLVMNEDKQVTATFQREAGRIAYLPLAARNEMPPPAAVSDDFHACSLNRALWTWIDPLGDSTYTIQSPHTQNARLAISVPAGTAHDIWVDGNFAPRVMQTINDTDFSIEAKYDSAVSLQYQLQGIFVEQNGDNFLRIELYSDGLGTNLFVGAFSPGTTDPLRVDIKVDVPIAAANVKPLYLRVRRQGNDWTVSYSLNGTAWNEAVSFPQALTVRRVGVYGSNAGRPAPAHTAQIDYFFDTVSPILPEDAAQNSLTVDITGQGTVGVNPVKANYACGEVITLLPNPSPGWVFGGWQGRDRGFVQDNGNGSWSLKMDAPRVVTAVFGAANQ